MPRKTVRTAGITLALSFISTAAAAQALRRFEEPHSPRPSSSSSSSSSSGSSSSSSSSSSDSSSSWTSSSSSSSRSSGRLEAAVGRAIGEGISQGLTAFGQALYDAGHDRRPGEGEQPKTFLSIDPYADGTWGAYTRTWRYDEASASWVKRDDYTDIRGGELKLNAFMATAHTVYAGNLGVRGYLQHFVAQGSWERFVEPRPEVGRTDSLDMFRAHVGPNLFGTMMKDVEVYALVGGMVMKGQNAPVAAVDLGIEARAYPLRPFALYSSGFVSVFMQGPPLIDGRFEAGVSLGRFDLRGGVRFLKQEPEQSFFGPIVSVTMRF